MRPLRFSSVKELLGPRSFGHQNLLIAALKPHLKRLFSVIQLYLFLRIYVVSEAAIRQGL